jgi:hypothetical protein
MKIYPLILILFLSGCDTCSNEIVQEIASPDGKYIATAFIRNCGATTSNSPQVYLRFKDEKIGATGNVFIGNHSDKIKIKWISNDHLMIYSDCEVNLLVSIYRGFTIEHQKSEPDAAANAAQGAP